MKIILMSIIAIWLFADVKGIIWKIKQMENIKYKFIPFVQYNPFEDEKVKKKPVKKEKKLKTFHHEVLILKVYAVFNDKVYINGKWYKVGDEIYGNKIVKIYPTKVVFIKNGKIFEIPIGMKILKVN